MAWHGKCPQFASLKWNADREAWVQSFNSIFTSTADDWRKVGGDPLRINTRPVSFLSNPSFTHTQDAEAFRKAGEHELEFLHLRLNNHCKKAEDRHKLTKAAIERGRAACREFENIRTSNMIYDTMESYAGLGLGNTIFPYKMGARSYISDELVQTTLRHSLRLGSLTPSSAPFTTASASSWKAASNTLRPRNTTTTPRIAILRYCLWLKKRRRSTSNMVIPRRWSS